MAHHVRQVTHVACHSLDVGYRVFNVGHPFALHVIPILLPPLCTLCSPCSLPPISLPPSPQ
ncbi:hypothetical protein MUK42_09433 [Musa troglodytarum]|uniref:Uncharacterized protein n=1 Tax=Musa troglodytarum TaxID=320322 RepID=A0A9E7EFQ3_9LILI|nr:hypothetical protein MUK42_09433 [Musa troglodytarum]